MPSGLWHQTQVQRTAFQKDSGSDTRSVVDREPLDVEDQAALYPTISQIGGRLGTGVQC